MEIPKEKLDDLVRRIVDAAHPMRIMLFGSAARGAMGRHSDVDIMVVVPDGAHRPKIVREIYANLWGLGLDVDILVATPSVLDYYADVPGYVYREALRDGVELYAA